jgi:hypothetical protein
MTVVEECASELAGLPRGIDALCEVVQGLLVHRDIAPFLYGLSLSVEQRDAANVRPLSEILSRMRMLDRKPLTAAREPAHRMPSVCRHFAVLLCGILRAQGVPARGRCGFGAYFTPGKFEDHWVCEYWNREEFRWILVDAQLDRVQREYFKVDFNPLDVPRDRFIIAGDAWRKCRSGGGDPQLFGLSFIPGLHGDWFIAGNVIRDLAALNRMEMLPWDVWGLMRSSDADLDDRDRQLLDRVAALTVAGDATFAEIRELYESDERLRVPPVVFNVDRNAPEAVAR